MNEGGKITRTIFGNSYKEAEFINIRAESGNFELATPKEIVYNGKDGGKKLNDFKEKKPVTPKVIKVAHKLIGKSKRDPGYNTDGTEAEDMMFKDRPARSVSITKDEMFSHTSETLGLYLDQLMRSLSIGDMETVALEMSSRFKNGTGGIYKSTTLDKEIENNKVTITFHDNFLNTFKNELKLVKYDPNRLKLITMKLLNFSSFWDKVSGLGITIHQVWSVKAEIKNYVYYEATGKWDCELIYTFYDHFGLDWDDITKHGEDRIPQYQTGNCFKAWYILQHYRNAKPFIAEMKKTVKISGN